MFATESSRSRGVLFGLSAAMAINKTTPSVCVFKALAPWRGREALRGGEEEGIRVLKKEEEEEVGLGLGLGLGFQVPLLFSSLLGEVSWCSCSRSHLDRPRQSSLFFW